MAKFEFDKAVRWARFDPQRQLARRPNSELPFLTEEDLAGSPVLLDTGVYIHQMQGKLPRLVEHLIDTRQVNHSTIAVQELMHSIGVLKPRDPRTPAVVNAVQVQIAAMPEHRLFAPDAEVLGRGALLSGMLCRLQGYSRSDRLKALQDSTLFLHAQKLGFTVVTANVTEFDHLLQLIPDGRVLLYRI